MAQRPAPPQGMQGQDLTQRLVEINTRTEEAEAHRQAKYTHPLNRTAEDRTHTQVAVPTQNKKLPPKKFCLINKANVGLGIHSQEAGVRILGVFQNSKDAAQHLRDLSQWKIDADSLGTIHGVPTMEWFLIGRDKKNDNDKEYITKKIELLKQMTEEEKRLSTDHFRRRHAQAKKLDARNPDAGAEVADILDDDEEDTEPNEDEYVSLEKKKYVYEKMRKMNQTTNNVTTDEDNSSLPPLSNNFPVLAELSRQKTAIILVMRDYTTETIVSGLPAEPAVMILDVCENEEIAKGLIKRGFSKIVYDYNMDCVNMYDWLFPDRMSCTFSKQETMEIQEEWRDPSQNKIMNYHCKQDEQSHLESMTLAGNPQNTSDDRIGSSSVMADRFQSTTSPL